MAKRLLTRRNFVKAAGGGMFAMGGTFGYTWRIEPHWVQYVHRDLPIENLPSSLHGKRLVQLSDLHVGPIVDDDFLIRSFHRVNALKPDVLVITGDLMSCRGVEQIDHTMNVLSHLNPAAMGTLTVLGNHDYGHGWTRREVADALVKRLHGAGHTVLRNDVAVVDGLNIAGIDDLWGPEFGPESMLRSLPGDGANLVLCHNPDVADLPVWGGYRGWILCGHTHGGQCKAPLLTPPILPVKNKRYSEGEIDLYDGRMMYINRGLGYLRRVRFNVRPEVTVFRLVSTEA